MNTDTIETAETPEARAPQPKGKRTTAKKAKPAKKARQPKKMAGKQQKADRSNKKAEVIAMMKRPKGATLAEIMAATKWQAHTVRGFVSILGSKGGEKIESSKSADGELRPPRRAAYVRSGHASALFDHVGICDD
jgi:hypothetical protein